MNEEKTVNDTEGASASMVKSADWQKFNNGFNSFVTEYREAALKSGVTDAERKAVIDKVQGDLAAHEKFNQELVLEKTKDQAEAQKLQDQINLLEKKLNRYDVEPGETKSKKSEIYKAFELYLKYGLDVASMKTEQVQLLRGTDISMLPQELKEFKTLRSDNFVQGQALVAPVVVAGITKKITETTPVLSLVNVFNTNEKSMIFSKRETLLEAPFAGELEDVNESNSTYGTLEIENHEMRPLSRVSNKLIAATAGEIVTEITSDMGEAMGVSISNSFTTGDGIKRPQGFLTVTVAQGLERVVSGVANNVTIEGVTRLLGALKTGYNGTYLFTRRTLSELLLLSDGVGQFLWQPMIAQGAPASLRGTPYVLAPSMPEIAPGSEAIALGDWPKAYRLLNGTAMTMIRDPFTLASKGVTRFIGARMVGGAVDLAEAIKVLVTSV